MTITSHAAAEEAAAYFAEHHPVEPAPGVAIHITPHGTYTRQWCRELIARGEAAGPLPLFGSPEWCQLPGGDPRKIASLVRAALNWYREGEDLAFRVAQEAYDQAAEENAYWDWSNARRRDLVAATLEDQQVRANRAAHARAMTERARTGRDYQGGPVAWDTEETA